MISYLFVCLFVCLSVCLAVCLSVNRITQKAVVECSQILRRVKPWDNDSRLDLGVVCIAI